MGSAANRISYAFDLHGPSLTLDTMCSSSMVGVHLACNSLRSGETSFAIAGMGHVLITCAHPRVCAHTSARNTLRN